MELNWKTEFSKDGYEIVKVKINEKYKYIGSKYNQKREIEKFKENLGLLKSNDIYIIFGLSCGEHLKELLKIKKSKNRILVIEHNEELIEYVKNKYDFINDEKFIITNNEDYIRSYIASIKSSLVDNTRIIHYSNYSKIFIEKVRESFATIKDEISSVIINRNTERLFGEQWFETLLKNIKYGIKATAINELKNKLKDVPAVIVSAGPSLERNIHELKCFNNAFILTGGRTLRSLQENEIKADLIGILDSGEVSYQLVEKRIGSLEIPLLFNETTNSKIVKEHNYKKIIFGNSTITKKIWEEELENLVVGGSVAHTLTKCAIYLGCNPIIFIGQDLAYTNDKGHAQIAYNELDEQIKNIKEEKLFKHRYARDSDIYVEDINGDLVRTSLVLNDFRKDFEKLILANPARKFINATEGGANIKGTEIKKLKDIIEILKGKEVKKIKIDDYLYINSKENEAIKVMDEIKAKIKEAMLQANKGLKELEVLKNNYFKKNNIDNNLKNLDFIDRELRRLITEIDIINTLVYEEIYKIENDDELLINNDDNKNREFKKIYNKNKKIYEIIKQALRRAEAEIKKCFFDDKQ